MAYRILEKRLSTLMTLATVLGIILLPGLGHAASGVTAYKVAQIAVPGAAFTYPTAVNKGLAVVGHFGTSSGATEGFLLRGGKYTTLVFPGSNNLTEAGGINDSGFIVGTFYGSDDIYHGFTYSKGSYTQYDLVGSANTSLLAVNNAGNLAGSAAPSPGIDNQGFVVIGGTATKFYASGSYATFVSAINNLNQSAGTYYDFTGAAHGFYRDASGNITLITFPGAQMTACQGITDSGAIAGAYFDATNEWHGFTYSGGTYTSQAFYADEGINNAGAVIGLYLGPGAPKGIRYGFLATPAKFQSYSTVKLPKATGAILYGTNDSNAMVGLYSDSAGTTHGLLYESGKVTNIDVPSGLPGSTTAYAINTSGTIVGSYRDQKTGDYLGFS